MKLFYKITLLAVTLLALFYYASFFILPSITIVNKSGSRVTEAEVDLPTSHLDFGVIADGAKNTLHYSLTQKQGGTYIYNIKVTERDKYQGSCGYVTNNEINKRVVITVHADKSVTCN